MAIRWERGCTKDSDGNFIVTETEFINDVQGAVLSVRVSPKEPNRHEYARKNLKAKGILLREKQAADSAEIDAEMAALNAVDTRSFENYMADVKPGFWSWFRS